MGFTTIVIRYAHIDFRIFPGLLLKNSIRLFSFIHVCHDFGYQYFLYSTLLLRCRRQWQSFLIGSSIGYLGKDRCVMYFQKYILIDLVELFDVIIIMIIMFGK